jgi:hypothetical protein
MAIYAPLYVVSLYMAIFRDVTPTNKENLTVTSRESCHNLNSKTSGHYCI